MDESKLVAELKAGSQAAFESLVRTTAPRMLAVARRLLNCDEDAADALQEAYVSAYRSIGEFEATSRLTTWLHRIVVNAALMRLRTRKRRSEVSIESLLPRYDDDGHRRHPRPAWEAPAESLLQQQEVRQMVRSRIQMLPEDYRTVLMLRDIEELDTSETARVLGISAGAVKTRLHRARMALRELLEKELG